MVKSLSFRSGGFSMTAALTRADPYVRRKDFILSLRHLEVSMPPGGVFWVMRDDSSLRVTQIVVQLGGLKVNAKVRNAYFSVSWGE